MKMFWDKMYKGNNRIWGEKPSELAVFAVYYMNMSTMSLIPRAKFTTIFRGY